MIESALPVITHHPHVGVLLADVIGLGLQRFLEKRSVLLADRIALLLAKFSASAESPTRAIRGDVVLGQRIARCVVYILHFGSD